MSYFTTGAALTAALNELPASLTGTYKAFDAFYYADKYMGAYAGTLTPIEHFVQVGAARGYQPNADFNPAFYQSQFSDLAGFDAAELLYHYVRFGLNEGRPGNATLAANDWSAYLTAYPAVAEYVSANLADFGGSMTNGAIAHYVKFGQAQGFTLPNTVGQTFTLTTGTDVLPGLTGSAGNTGTSGNDFINASSSTFNSDDVINGGAGSDTLTVTAAAAGSVIANVSNVETIRITNGSATASDNYALNMVGATGVTELGSRLSSANVSFLNVQSAATVSAFGTTAGTVTATFLNTLASGTADSVSLKADGGATVTFDVKGTGSGLFETVNLASAGSTKNTVTLTAGMQAGIKKVVATGAADLTTALEKTVAKAEYDGTAATGKQVIAVSAGDTGSASLFYVETVKTGSGDDTVDVTDLIGGSQAATTFFGSTNPKAIDGGAGTDTLKIAEAFTSLSAADATDGTAQKHTVSNIEVIEQTANAAVDASLLTGTQTVKISAASNAFGGTSAKSVTLDAGDKIDVAAGIDTTFGLNAVLKDASGTADNVAISLTDSGQGRIVIAQDANSKDVESVTITSAGTGTSGNVLTALAAGNTTTLNLAGAAKATVAAVQLKQPTSGVSVIDASGMTGALTLGGTGADFKSTDTDKISVKLGSGTNAVYAAATSVDADVVEGTTGTDTLYLTEGNSATALKTTVKNIDNVQITAIANDREFDLTNFTSVGKLTLVGTDTAAEDILLDKVATGQAIEVKTSTAGSPAAAQLVDAITIKGATGVTSSGITLVGDTAQAALALTVSTGGVSVTDNIKDTSGFFKNNQVTVAGTAATAEVTSVTLSGGGAASSSTTAAFDLRTGSNVNIATVNATALASDLKIDNATLKTGAAVNLGAGNNTVTVARAQLARDVLVIDGGAGNDTVKVTTADLTADVALRPGLKNVETIDVTFSAANSSAGFDLGLALTDTTGVSTIKATLAGTDDDLVVTGASGTLNLQLAGTQAAATNVVSVAGATGLVVTSTAAVGATAGADLTAADATSVTIKQASGSSGSAADVAFDAVTVAKATSVTLGGSDKTSAGVAYNGAISLATLAAAELTALTVDSTNGKVSVSTVTADKLANVTVTGAGGLDFGLTGATTAALASFDASGASGAVKIGQAVDFTSSATVKLGSGDDQITLDILTEGGLTVDGGGNPTSSPAGDTLLLAGANNLGLSVIDLSAADQVSQLNGSLNSAVQSSFENITLSGLSGSFGANITGTSGANTIVGTKNADNIVGGRGVDVITGGAGDDTIDIADSGATSASSATINFANSLANNGNDTITGFKVSTVATGGDVIGNLAAGFVGATLDFANGAGTPVSSLNVDLTSASNGGYAASGGVNVITAIIANAATLADADFVASAADNKIAIGNSQKIVVVAQTSTSATAYVYFVTGGSTGGTSDTVQLVGTISPTAAGTWAAENFA